MISLPLVGLISVSISLPHAVAVQHGISESVEAIIMSLTGTCSVVALKIRVEMMRDSEEQ